MSLFHGSHPNHGFDKLRAPPGGRQCSLCRAQADISEVEWFQCLECDFLLCGKCFQIPEKLLDAPQVMIRHPMLDNNRDDAVVRTRPWKDSYALAPLYPGRLLTVVSMVRRWESESVTYLRIATGGWINQADVVCVTPHESATMRMLAALHLQNRSLGAEIASGAAVFEDLKKILIDCMETIDDNEAYGAVMSSLLMFPVISTVEVRLEKYSSPPPTKPLIEFTHFVLHFVLCKLEEQLERDAQHAVSTMMTKTMSILYGDVLAHCIYISYNLVWQWKVRLNSSFAYLVVRAIVVMSRMRDLIRGEPLGNAPALCAPAVTVVHSTMDTELRRHHRLLLVSTDIAGRLLVQCIQETRLDLSLLQPLREHLHSSGCEGLARIFCDSLSTFAECSLLPVQRSYLDLDALEVVGRLSVCALQPESQIAAFRLISYLGKQCPHNIGAISAVVLESLLKMLPASRNVAVYVAGLNCFYELAYNDPRITDAVSCDEGTSPIRGRGCSALASPHHGSLGEGTPFQLMYLYQQPSGLLIALCASCAAAHPPSDATLEERPQYAYFRCQCVACCSSPSSSGATTGVNIMAPHNVPQTSALRLLARGLANQIDVASATQNNPAVLNALGRLLLRLPPMEPQLLQLVVELSKYKTLARVEYAALAVAVNMGIPAVQQKVADCEGTVLIQYINAPYSITTPQKNWVNQTPADSYHRSELGLSASPSTASAIRSSTVSDVRGTFSYSCDMVQGVKLFGNIQPGCE